MNAPTTMLAMARRMGQSDKDALAAADLGSSSYYENKIILMGKINKQERVLIYTFQFDTREHMVQLLAELQDYLPLRYIDQPVGAEIRERLAHHRVRRYR